MSKKEILQRVLTLSEYESRPSDYRAALSDGNIMGAIYVILNVLVKKGKNKQVKLI